MDLVSGFHFGHLMHIIMCRILLFVEGFGLSLLLVDRIYLGHSWFFFSNWELLLGFLYACIVLSCFIFLLFFIKSFVSGESFCLFDFLWRPAKDVAVSSIMSKMLLVWSSMSFSSATRRWNLFDNCCLKYFQRWCNASLSIYFLVLTILCSQ